MFEEWIDPLTRTNVCRTKFRPVLIKYKVGRTECEKAPDQGDFELLSKIDSTPIPASITAVKFPIDDMYHGSRLRPKGYEWVHQLYTRRTLIALGQLHARVSGVKDRELKRILLSLVYHQLIPPGLYIWQSRDHRGLLRLFYAR